MQRTTNVLITAANAIFRPVCVLILVSMAYSRTERLHVLLWWLSGVAKTNSEKNSNCGVWSKKYGMQTTYPHLSPNSEPCLILTFDLCVSMQHHKINHWVKLGTHLWPSGISFFSSIKQQFVKHNAMKCCDVLRLKKQTWTNLNKLEQAPAVILVQ